MTIFEVYPDGNDDAMKAVDAPTARQAAEAYWEEAVIDGDAYANREERLIVLHADGPNVDPSATWHTEDGETFALFDVHVALVEVSSIEPK